MILNQSLTQTFLYTCLKDVNLTELTIMDSMGDDHTLTQNDKFDI